MAGPWTIETEPGNHYNCSNNARSRARRWAKKDNRPILVTYHGPRDEGKTRDPGKVNFTVGPDGSENRKVDPGWWESP